MNPIKVLFLSANPSDSVRLALDEEAREIDNKIRTSKYRDSIVLKTRWAVRPDDLLQALNEELPHIVHFSGHGSGAQGLVLHDNDGSSIFVSSTALERLFRTLKDNIRIVVLNACYTCEQAEVIFSIIDCVVGMNASIGDDAAIKFASSFYRAIGFGRSIQNAFEQGLAAIALANLSEEDVPELFMRDGIDPDSVFLVEKSLWSNQEELTVSKIAPPMNPRVWRPSQVRSVVGQVDRGVGDSFLKSSLPQIADNMRTKLKRMSIVMLDIDELTIINKQYSTSVGNEVIANVARIIHEESNAESSGRCGDDTFYAFLPGSDIMDAMNMAERLRLHIQHYNWLSLAAGLRVTCCLGIAQLHPTEPVRDWIIRAVCGLIAAKDSGQNKTEIGPAYLSSKQSRELEDYYS